jgi:hypothetical protein
MALNTQIIDLPLWGGLETKQDPFSVQPGKLLEIRNADLTKSGSLKKRNGFESLTQERLISSDCTITSATTIGVYGNQLLLIGEDAYASSDPRDGSKLFSYSEAVGAWMYGGKIVPMKVTVDQVSRSITTLVSPTVAYGDNYLVFAYDWSSYYSYANIVVADQMNLVKEKINIEGSYTSFRDPRINYIFDAEGNKVFSVMMIFKDYYLGPSIGRWTWREDINSNGTFEPYLYTNVDVNAVIHDTCIINKDTYTQYLHAYRSIDKQIEINKFDTTGVELANRALQTVGEFGPLFGMTIKSFPYHENNEEIIFVLYQNEYDEKLYVHKLHEDLSGFGGEGEGANPYVLDTTPNSFHRRVGNIVIERSENLDNVKNHGAYRIYTVAYEMLDNTREDGYSGSLNFFLMDEYCNVITGSKTNMSGMCLAAKPFTWNGRAYFPLMHTSPLQSSYYICTYDVWEPHDETFCLYTHARILGDVGGPKRFADGYAEGLSDTVNIGYGKYTFAALRQDDLTTTGAISYSIQAITIDMQPDAMQITNVGPTSQISGAYIGEYDGSLQELGFMHYPEILVPSVYTYGGHIVGEQTYYYKFVYEWYDKKGQLHKSTPSPALAVEFPEASSTGRAQFDFRQADIGNFDKMNNAKVGIYRTIQGGSIFYKVGTSAISFPIGSSTTTLSDGLSDTDAAQNEYLYTTGGVLENVCPPGSDIMTVKNDRIFLVPMDDRQAIWYSKRKLNTVGFEFAGEFVIRLDMEGNNTGLAVMDDKLVIFKERSLWYVYGDGPNSLGQGAFSSPKSITSDVGAINHNSIVLMPNGLMFKSHKGIYLLDRSLQTKYIGAPVEQYNQYDVVSATLVEDKNQIIFLLSDGQPALVYDYYHDQWSTYYNHIGVDACTFNGQYTWVNSEGCVKTRNDTFTDGNFLIPLKVKTGWIKLSGLQNYQRCYSASILGKFKSHHNLMVNIYTDYDDTTIKQTVNFDTQNLTGDEPLQFRIHLKYQKCEAIQFEIYDDEMHSPYESCELTSISLELGLKSGLMKQPQTKSL